MLLYDGSNLLNRMLHSHFWELTNSKGLRIGGVHGVLANLARTCETYHRRHGVVIAWDKGVSAHRKSIHPGYKGSYSAIQRKLASPEIEDRKWGELYIWSRQLLHCTFLPLAGCLSVQIENVEADDVISWFCTHIKGQKKIIISRDKDFWQLIDDDTSCFDQENQTETTKTSFIHDQDLLPEHYVKQWLLMRAMIGDVNDKIDGVPYIGPVYAKEISKLVLTNQALDPKYRHHRQYLENQPLIARNLQLGDLSRTPPELDAQIAAAVSSSTVQPDMNSERLLHNKLDALELRQVRASVNALLESNIENKIKDIFHTRLKL